MEPTRRRERASSFGPAAELYDRVRPTYPAEAVAWAWLRSGRVPAGSATWVQAPGS